MPYAIYAKPIHEYLTSSARKVLLLPHQQPDPDALSSLCAFVHYLTALKIPHMAFCSAPPSETLSFLPHFREVVTDTAALTKETFDTICTFDVGDLHRALMIPELEEIARTTKIINFDHHIPNRPFGDLKLVDQTASSTTTVLYHYFTYNHITIDKTLATCLMTGLIADTENFTNAGTRAGTLEIAADLMRRGAHMNLIKEHLLKDKTLAGLKFWSVIFDRLYHNPKHNLAITYVKAEDLHAYPIAEDDVEGVSNFIKMMRDADMVLFLKETRDGKVKGSLRTTGNIDCEKIAAGLGGGGHKKAAGFCIAGNIKEHGDGYVIVEGGEDAAKLNELLRPT